MEDGNNLLAEFIDTVITADENVISDRMTEFGNRLLLTLDDVVRTDLSDELEVWRAKISRLNSQFLIMAIQDFLLAFAITRNQKGD